MEALETLASLIPEPQTEEEGKAILEWLFNEMEQHEGHMRHDRIEIERLRAETQVIAAHTDSKIASLKLQVEQMQKTRPA